MPACGWCGSERPTAQGIRSHISQTQRCAEKQKKFLQKLESSDTPLASESNGIEVEPHLDLYDESVAPVRDEEGMEWEREPQNPNSSTRNQYRTTVEEVVDDEAPGILPAYNPHDIYVCDFPAEKFAGQTHGKVKTTFEEYRSSQKAQGLEPWAPFRGEEDWEHFRWMVESGVSWGKIDAYLKLKKVRTGLGLPYKTGRAFRKLLDKLPKGPEFVCTPFHITGNVQDQVLSDGSVTFQKETLELWHRNPVDCIAELISNPSFKEHLAYAPQQHFRNSNGTNREFSEMWTGDWWWDTQLKLPEGSTVAAIILASDQTQLSTFSGDKKAWPVYLSLGNLDKHLRRQPSARANILLGYVPPSKLECFTPETRSLEGQRLFHDCMRLMLKPLVEAGMQGIAMTCADGHIRRVHPIVAAYIADYIEQCLVACCRENSCPRCLVNPKERGTEPLNTIWRDPGQTIQVLNDQSNGIARPEFKEQNLRPIHPFWDNLPFCDIFSCFTPDILHQIHKGVFGDHIAKWVGGYIGKGEIDNRFRTLPLHPTLRHFKKGISCTTQWTGKEYKAMEKVYLGIIAGTTDPKIERTVRALLDFTYYSHFEVHTDESLAALDRSWVEFHENKSIFESLDIRTHFNISKIHNIKHYVDSIRSKGTADGYNTEASERLHINYVKAGYRASNKYNYTVQMANWLAQREAVQRFASYLQWAVPGYHAAVGEEEDDDDEVDGDNESPNEENPVTNDTSRENVDEEEFTQVSNLESSVILKPAYSLAKKPPFSPISAEAIETEYDAKDFVWYLEEHLVKSKTQFNPITDNIRFSTYKQFTVHHPPLKEAATDPSKDVVHAQLPAPMTRSKQGGIRKGTPPKTSTVLVRIRAKKEGPHSSPLDGISIARVRLIFKLPASIGEVPTPLAYVNWFRTLREPSASNGLYKISLDRRAQYVHSGILPITDIIQTCHLIPCFSSSTNPEWDPINILDQAPIFYVNPYLRHRDFILLRYETHLHNHRQAKDREERERLRQKAQFAMTLD